MITPTRRVLQESCPLYYPLNPSFSRKKHVFTHLVRQQGHGNDELILTKVLFLGCGDLLSTLQSTTFKHLINLEIHLNDQNHSVLARNLLLLKVISDVDTFNPDKEEDITFLWDVWYNLEWSERTVKRFHRVLENLLNGVLPKNVSVPNSSHLESLREIWKVWVSVISQKKCQSKSLVEKVKKDRSFHIENVFANTSVEMKKEKTDLFSKAVDAFAMEFETKNSSSNENLHDIVKEKMLDEIRQYYKRGNCRMQASIEVVCVNPTMLNPTTKTWELDPSLYPFGGYLPMSNVELDTSFQEKILIRSCQEILKSLVSSYRRRLNSVQVTFHLQDPLEYCYTEKTIKFDVVDCSFLADHVGLPNLISACSGILADHPEAILCTETQYWSGFDYSMQNFIEESLCCPLSMIPTIYGLRLMNHITLGPVSLDLEHKSRQFLWQKTPSFENVILSPSSTLTCCLDRLAKKCFAVEFPLKDSSTGTKNLFSAKWYSPLTFNYILSSMILRLGGESWFQNIHHNSNIPPAFQLTTKILDAWQKDQSLLKMTAQSNVKETKVIYSNYSPSRTPLLRLILAPESTYKNYVTPGENGLANNPRDISSFPDVHVIDNFSLEVRKTPEGNCAFVSFLMLPDHGLGKTHRAVLMDVVNNVPAFIFDSIESMQTENLQLSYPFDLKDLKIPPARVENTLMTLDSCVEFEDKYQLEVTVDCEDVSGFKVFLSQPQPLKTAFITTHVVKLSLGPQVDSNPLRISFSHPVCDEELAIVPQGHTFKVTLKKGLHVPWPWENQRNDKLKWDAANLEKWWDAPHGSNSMRMHLDSQFELYHLEYYPSLERTKPLNAVRDAIRELFYQPNSGYLQLGIEQDDFLRILIHQPCVTSPTGGPMLVISVHDPQMQKTLASKGKLNAVQHDVIFNRFYAELEASTLEYTKMFTTPEEMILWRYIFRVNSTKILPNIWQKKNLPLGGDSPWLATFLSPHYLDCPFKKLSYEEFKLKNPKIVEKLEDKKGGCCAACKKTCEGLERCFRCLTVKYCSVECQKGHWSQHRSVCGK